MDSTKKAQLNEWLDTMFRFGAWPPSIGMTAEDVKRSSWGSPQEISRTTTVYSVNELWMYPGCRYIYFDGGIVTLIQEYEKPEGL